MAQAYGLAEGISHAYQGYKKEETARVDRDDELKSRKMKFESAQNQLNQEGFKESIQRLMMGDVDGAMSHWNATGKNRMTDLQMDENQVVSWTEDNGEAHKLPLNALAAMAGVDLPKPGKPSEPWAAGPAKSGVLYHKGTGETKKIPGGGADSTNFRGSGYDQKDWADRVNVDEDVIRAHYEKMHGKMFEMGSWALDSDAKLTYENLTTLASVVRRKTNLDDISPNMITNEISKRTAPFLKTKEEWHKMAVEKADKLTNYNIWDNKKYGMSYDKWIEKEAKSMTKDASKALKGVIADKAGLVSYIKSIPTDFAERELPADPAAGGIPTDQPAPAAVPQQGAVPAAPSGQGIPTAPAPQQAPAQAPPPTGHNPAQYKTLGGNGKIPVGTPVGKDAVFADGTPILEGMRFRHNRTGKSYLVVNGKPVEIGSR